MIILPSKGLRLTPSIFKFASNVPNFDLIDIVNDPAQQKKLKNQQSFLQSQGYFVYRSCLVVNDRIAETLGIEGLKFSFYRYNPEKAYSGPASEICSYEIKFQTSDKESVKVAGTTVEKETKIATYKDSYKTVYASQVVAPKNMQQVAVPISSVNSQNCVMTLKDATRDAKSSDLDPALLSSVGSFSVQTLASAASLASQNLAALSSFNLKTSSPEMIAKNSLSAFRTEIANNNRGYQNNVIVNADNINQRDIGGETNRISNSAAVSFKLLPVKRIIEQDFYISKKDLNGSLSMYVEIKAVKKQGPNSGNNGKKKISVPENVYTKIEHQKNLNDFLANPEPPTVKIVNTTNSRVTFSVKREDPTLTRVKVFRIIENPYFLNAAVSTVGIYEFKNSNQITITDFVKNIKPNKITYRFIVVNGDNSLGGFTSKVIVTKAKPASPINSVSTPVSIFAINQGDDGIRVTVDVLNDEVLSFRLLRQEIGKTGEYYDSIVQVKGDEELNDTLVLNQKGSYTFVDRNTFLGRKYRYFLAYRLGAPGSAGIAREVQSDEDEIIIRRFSLEALPFAVNISDPTINIDSSGFSSINFKIEVTETKELFNTVISALRGAGIGEEFISSLQADNIKAKNFIMMIVERYNVLTGRRTSFGIYPVGNFSDNDITRQKLSLPPPTPDVPYRYVFKVCLQDPRVFLQTTDIALINQFGTEIQRKGAKFTRKIYTRLGVLPSESDLRDGVPIEKLIEESQLGLEIEKSVSAKKNAIKIENLALKTRTFYNLLSWSTLGDFSQVSYFNVYCILNGQRSLLGAVSTCFDSSAYKFRDDRYFNEVGTKKYQIEAVSFLGEKIAGSGYVESTVYYSVPVEALSGLVTVQTDNGSESVPFDITQQNNAGKSQQISQSPSSEDLTKPSTGIVFQLPPSAAPLGAMPPDSDVFDAFSGRKTGGDYWSQYDLPASSGQKSRSDDSFNRSSPRGLPYPNQDNIRTVSIQSIVPMEDRASQTKTNSETRSTVETFEQIVNSGKFSI